MMVHASNSSTHDGEAEGSDVQGRYNLCSELGPAQASCDPVYKLKTKEKACQSFCVVGNIYTVMMC